MNAGKPKRLPDAEFEIMDYVWEQTPPVTTSQVAETVGAAHGWKIQTVVTLFGRLLERGFLRAERGKGRERDFYPLISRDAYLQLETENFVNHYHKRSYASLLSALHRDRLSRDDLDALRAWLREERPDA